MPNATTETFGTRLQYIEGIKRLAVATHLFVLGTNVQKKFESLAFAMKNKNYLLIN